MSSFGPSTSSIRPRVMRSDDDAYYGSHAVQVVGFRRDLRTVAITHVIINNSWGWQFPGRIANEQIHSKSGKCDVTANKLKFKTILIGTTPKTY